MSRIGRLPIDVPSEVAITLEDRHITVTGPKGTLVERLGEGITVERQDNKLIVRRASDEPSVRALHGLTRSLIANMITGVTVGFTRSLQMTGTGYRAQLMGKNLVIQAGFSHAVEVAAPENITFSVEQVQGQRSAESRINVYGIDKALVGNIASRIRSIRKPEPYLGKGIRYTDEVIRRKAGKAGGKKK
jgi:large subunit ribosomal protein L6